MTEPPKPLPPLQPLRITCGSSNCIVGLHSYKPPKRTRDLSKCACKDCGANPVDWSRVRSRKIDDIDYTYEMLKTEFIRHDFFCRPFDEKAVAAALKDGRDALYSSIKARLDKSVTMATPFRDGMQTPFEGKAVYYAQHATATCCRKCLNIWHGIDLGREMTSEETDYCVGLISGYLKLREHEIFSE